MMARPSPGPVGSIALLLAAVSAPAAGQSPAGQSPASPSRIAIDVRMGFLVTRTEGYADRPLLGVDVRLQIVRPRVGAGPGLGVMAGAAIGFADIFGETQSESHRWTGGVEFPWAIASAGLGPRPIEIVPLLQAGYVDSNGGDRRSGFIGRVAVGLRVPLGSDPVYFGFEPFGLTLLPDPDVERDGPSSRLAFEFGLLRVGWTF